MATIKAGTYRFNDVLTRLEEYAFNVVDVDFNAYAETEEAGSFLLSCNQLRLIDSGDAGNTSFEMNTSIVALNGEQLPEPRSIRLYDEYGGVAVWQTEWASDYGVTLLHPIRAITFDTDQEVYAWFEDWFTANAVEQKQISGKWKFNDVPTAPSNLNEVVFVTADVNGNCNGVSFNVLGVVLVQHADDELPSVFAVICGDIATEESTYLYISEDYDTYSSGWQDEAYKTIDFGTEPQTVSAEFYNWLTANATQPMASVSHNGEEIASLFPGQTATLKCAGMKMVTDVVVAVADNVGGGAGANIVPLTVTENGVYDTYYETATEVWDSNTEYAGSVTVDGVTLSFKKAEHLIVPDDLNELLSPKYTGTCEFIVDGETVTREEPLIDNIDITEGVCATYQSYAVIWVKQAAPLNEQFGISFLEDNTVYITNLLQMLIPQEYGATYVKTICKAPTKKVENVAYRPVTVALPISKGTYVRTINAGHDTRFSTSEYYKYFQIIGPEVQPLTITPSAVEQTFSADEGKCFTSVTVGAVDLSNLSSMHILCGIYLKTLPQTQYAVGEWINADGGVIVAQYTDGTTAEVPLSHEYIWGFTTNNPGVIRLTVKYSEGGITSQTVYDITVT